MSRKPSGIRSTAVSEHINPTGEQTIHNLIGSRIRELRIAAKLTQAELAGDFITRNMLSKIENGNAVPSLQTIEYLAQRLNISPGYFFESGTKELSEPLDAYKKLRKIELIRRLYSRCDYVTALNACRELAVDTDDELNLIMADCLYNLGTKEFRSGRLLSAHTKFTDALEHAANTVYPTAYLTASAAAYLRIIGTVDLELIFHPIESESSDESALFTSSDSLDLYMYSRILTMFSHGKFKEGAAILNSELIKNRIYSMHLSAKLALGDSDLSIAHQILDSLLQLDIDDVMEYQIYSDLELCCSSEGNYKAAYEYSQKKLELFKKMHK